MAGTVSLLLKHKTNRFLCFFCPLIYVTLCLQLEDFEREVNASAIAEKSQRKQNVITRHMQFIAAIREQINHVEKSMSTSVGNSLRNMNLNEQDRDGLELFLSGEKPQEAKDNNILRRFLDPGVSSSSKDDIDEKKTGENVSIKVNGIADLDYNLELENFPTRMDLGPSSSYEVNYDTHREGTWDLEASEAKDNSYLQKNNLRNITIFGSLGNFLSTHGNRASRSFIKRLKDGEERRQYPPYSNVRPGMLVTSIDYLVGLMIYRLSTDNSVCCTFNN